MPTYDFLVAYKCTGVGLESARLLIRGGERRRIQSVERRQIGKGCDEKYIDGLGGWSPVLSKMSSTFECTHVAWSTATLSITFGYRPSLGRYWRRLSQTDFFFLNPRSVSDGGISRGPTSRLPKKRE